MTDELKSIEKNDKWRLVKLPYNKKCIDVKWDYKTKLKLNGEATKYNTMLVVRVFLQKYGQDYNEVHTLVARIETIILIIAVVIYNN